MLWEKFAALKLGERAGNVNRTDETSLAAGSTLQTQLPAIFPPLRSGGGGPPRSGGGRGR
jgi:hypothetical protein